MDNLHLQRGRISKNKRCSPCMCCIKKRIEKTCKITTTVNKSELITNDDICDHECKDHESKHNDNINKC